MKNCPISLKEVFDAWCDDDVFAPLPPRLFGVDSFVWSPPGTGLLVICDRLTGSDFTCVSMEVSDGCGNAWRADFNKKDRAWAYIRAVG